MRILHDFADAPTLTTNDIQVWQMDLQQLPDRLTVLAATLSADERARAARFRLLEHRDRFIAGRGLLRELLSVYLNRPAATLRFGQGAHGKPVLIGDEAAAGLHFNLSHSGDRVLYALARREVGVDVESLNRKVDYFAVAERICTARELAILWRQSCEHAALIQIFFGCWTRKEALSKALGEGLASGLRQFDVCACDNELSNRRVVIHDAEDQAWSVFNLVMEKGWMGALAAKGTDWSSRCHWEVSDLCKS